MKRAALITICTVVAVACVAARLAWIYIATVRSEWSIPSPNNLYVAKISSNWRVCFWGKNALETHELIVESKDGLVVRKIVITEPWTERPQGPVMDWTADSDRVYLVIKPHDGPCTGLNIPVHR